MKEKNQKLVTEKGYKRMIAKTIMSPVIYLVVIVMLATNNQIMEPENNIKNLLIIALMAAYTVSILYSELRLRASRVEQLKLGFENAIGKNIRNLKLPIMFISNTGKVVWENSISSEL